MITAKATITNTALTANTEASYAFPAGTKKFEIKLRDVGSTLLVGYITGLSAYMTIPAGASYSENDAKVGGSTLYFKTADSGQVAEIKIWK